MKLWVDDLRKPPDQDWLWAKTSQAAVSLLRSASLSKHAEDQIHEISFDHDLGGNDTTRKVVLWLCENGSAWPKIVRVHTANPVGREWLIGMIDRYGPGITHGTV